MRVTLSFCRSNLVPLIAALMFLGPVCGHDKSAASTKTPASKTQAAAAAPAPAPVATVAERDSARTAGDSGAAATARPEAKNDQPRVDVYLFHGTYRCYSCNLMEKLTVDAIDEYLAAEKEKGRVTFAHINVEEPQHAHFIDDYRLAAISIILSQKVNGVQKQWKNLEQVWPLLRQPEQFKSYVVKEIRAYLVK